jgi:hypothetical protein
METEAVKAFPYVKLNIPYSSSSSRLTSFFRLFCALPVLVIAVLLASYKGTGITFFPCMLSILFRQKYPKWWFDWNYSLARFTTRILSYLLLLRDEYPAFEEEQAINLELRFPNAATELSRGMPLIKWFLAIPHLIILAFLYIAVVLLTIIAWFAILFTAKYPVGFHEFVVGVIRWSMRVSAYAFFLITDEYPPFRLSE